VVRSAENVVSMDSTRFSNASCWAAAIAIAFSVVKSYCGGTASLAAWRAWSVRIVLSKTVDFGATMSRVTSWPDVADNGASGRMSAPRIAVSARTRITAASTRRRSSVRLGWTDVVVR